MVDEGEGKEKKEFFVGGGKNRSGGNTQTAKERRFDGNTSRVTREVEKCIGVRLSPNRETKAMCPKNVYFGVRRREGTLNI